MGRAMLSKTLIQFSVEPGKFIFQCPIFLSFHTVHVVLKARKLKWFALPFSSGPRSVSNLHHVVETPHCLLWVALHIMAHSFI